MATILSSLLGERLGPLVSEQNLEIGEVYTFTGAAGDNRCCFCWRAPGDGTAVVEIWGAGGAGARLCCCGAGHPGNSGAYAKMTVSVCANRWIGGCTGRPCHGTGTCFPGCSEHTGIIICHAGGCSCLCAEGGVSGMGMCQTGSPVFCCLLCCGYPGTQIGSAGCGIICNANRYTYGAAYHNGVGTATLCRSRISCTHWRHCNPCCIYNHIHYVATPPGVISDEGSFLMLQSHSAWSDGVSAGSPAWAPRYNAALSAGSSSAGPTNYHYFCWGSGKDCSCYDVTGCDTKIPYGIGGVSGMPCDNVRAQGMKGGPGAVRIRFIPN